MENALFTQKSLSMTDMKTYQDYYEQAASTPVPTEVDESHAKYLAEWSRGEWPQHETRPLSITTWYACWLHAEDAGVPMYVDNSIDEVKA